MSISDWKHVLSIHSWTELFMSQLMNNLLVNSNAFGNSPGSGTLDFLNKKQNNEFHRKIKFKLMWINEYLELLLLAICNWCLDLAFSFQRGDNILVFPTNLMGKAAKAAVLKKKVRAINNILTKCYNHFILCDRVQDRWLAWHVGQPASWHVDNGEVLLQKLSASSEPHDPSRSYKATCHVLIA